MTLILSFGGKLRLLFADFIILFVSMAAGYLIRLQGLSDDFFTSYGVWFVVCSFTAALYLVGAYDVETRLSFRNISFRVLLGVVLGLTFVVIINYLLAKDRAGIFGRGTLFLSLAFFLISTLALRYGVWWSLKKSEGALSWLFLTDDQCMDSLKADLKKHNAHGKAHFSVSPWGDLKDLIVKKWNGVVLATPSHRLEENISEELMLARFAGHQVLDLSDFYENAWQKVPVYYLGHEWFVLSDGFRLINNPVRLRLKRLMDLTLSSLLLLLLWPLMLIAAICIKLESAGPALYAQIRTGKDGKDFRIFKFRSMRQDAEKGGAQWAAKNDNRVTRIGKWLRLTRIDELPQLWNVFRGDMSFIGPRPERPEFNGMLEEKIPFYRLRHLVRPGITGWAQVKYPYGASVEDAKEKLQYDLFYIKNYNLLLDIQIIIKTVQIVLFARGR